MTETYAEVAEGVRAAIAAYTQALDDGRTEDIVACFCPDGAFELAGKGASEGHDALRETYGRWKPKVPQKHIVSNTLITEWSDDEATATSDVVLLVQGESGWSVQFVSRYLDVLCRDGDEWLFHRRTVT
jgi:ketosteroid isomerase-like protein